MGNRDDGYTDPRKLGGDIAGPGGPYDREEVVIDTSRAIILDNTTVAIGHGIETNNEVMTLLLGGRIARTSERANVLIITNADGAAALVTEIVALASRAGFGQEFLDLVDERMKDIPK